MSVQVYLNFNGNCKEAVEYYAEVFETEQPRIMQFKDMPPNGDMPVKEEYKNLVIHAEIMINGTTIMFSDTLPEMKYVVGNHIHLLYNSSDIEDIRKKFGKMEADGVVTMPLGATFFSKCYGQLIDKYGVAWMFSCADTNH